jgi:hypothetical protein
MLHSHYNRLIGVCILLFNINLLNAQTLSGKYLIWENIENPDPRLSVKTGTTTINSGEYEGTTLVIKNLTNRKLFITIRQTIIDFCGVELVRNPSFTLMPNETIGGSTFFGGFEQYDYKPKCNERKKYAENFSTRISNIKMNLTRIKEADSDATRNSSKNQETIPPTGTSYYDIVNNRGNNTQTISNPRNTNDEDFWGNKKTSEKPSSASQNNIYISDKCSPQRIGIMGNVGADCVPLTFISEKTIQFNSTTSEIRTDNSPDNFILTYKRADDLLWSEKEVTGNQIKYNLSGLDPCTRYEIKIQRNCGGGERSKATTPLQFTTACPGISLVQSISTTASTAKMNYRIRMNMSSCNFQSLNKRVVFVYRNMKTQKSQTVEFASNETPYLVDLMPNTTYSIKAALVYQNRKYSTYTTPIMVKTKLD